MASLAYLRVSTEEQARSGLGLDAQLEAIESSLGKPAQVFVDDGYSGSDPKRPALLEALGNSQKMIYQLNGPDVEYRPCKRTK